MTGSIRRWSGDDISTLRMLAQKYPAATIAEKLGRSPAALAVKAHELKLSLKLKRPTSDHQLSHEESGPGDFDLKQ
jgi:hypothetical protein